MKPLIGIALGLALLASACGGDGAQSFTSTPTDSSETADSGSTPDSGVDTASPAGDTAIPIDDSGTPPADQSNPADTPGGECSGPEDCPGFTGPCSQIACEQNTCVTLDCLPAGYCFIDATCFGNHATNPKNPCETCKAADPTCGVYHWTPITTSVSCGGTKVCRLGVCVDPLYSDCGGLAGLPCPDNNYFCEIPPQYACSLPEEKYGVCIPKQDPAQCSTYVECPKVCGCDGVTYCDDCERRINQVSKMHDGPCE